MGGKEGYSKYAKKNKDHKNKNKLKMILMKINFSSRKIRVKIVVYQCVPRALSAEMDIA